MLVASHVFSRYTFKQNDIILLRLQELQPEKVKALNDKAMHADSLAMKCQELAKELERQKASTDR